MTRNIVVCMFVAVLASACAHTAPVRTFDPYPKALPAGMIGLPSLAVFVNDSVLGDDIKVTSLPDEYVTGGIHVIYRTRKDDRCSIDVVPDYIRLFSWGTPRFIEGRPNGGANAEHAEIRRISRAQSEKVGVAVYASGDSRAQQFLIDGCGDLVRALPDTNAKSLILATVFKK